MVSSNDYNMLRLRLEEASKIVTSSIVSKEERQFNENIFIDFRSSKSPYEFCKYLLETSTEPYVLFQAVYTLKDATIREWSLLSINLLNELENFLLNYVIKNYKACDGYVQRQILQAISVLYKRRKLCNKNQQQDLQSQRKSLIETTIEFFKSNDSIEIKSICCSLMLALLNEFSNTNRSSNIGLSFTSHLNAKCLFEKNEFKIMLIFVFETLEQLIENGFSENQIYRHLLTQLLNLIEQSFSWEFTSSNNIFRSTLKSVEQNQTLALKPTPEFKEIFLNPNLSLLLFRTYGILRKDNELAHVCMQSIIQLSTINGPIFSEITLRHKYLEHFLKHFINLFNNGQLQDYELLNLSSLIENLLLTFNLHDYSNIDEAVLKCFFDFVTQFIVNCFNAEKMFENDSKKYFDSYEKILMALIRFKEFKDGDLFRKYSKPIFDAFIESRLYELNSPVNRHELNFNINKNFDNYNSELIDEDLVEDDLQRYKDVLFAISEFSRFIPEYCVGILAKLLTERFLYFTQILSQITSSQGNQQLTSADNPARFLNSIYEDIHWLLLISGFIIIDIENDVECKIPNEIMNYSISISSLISLESTMNFFKEKINTIDITSMHQVLPCDPVCVLIFMALQLCELETQMHSMKMLHFMSPQVSTTLMWFLKEFTRTYLFMNEKNYQQISPTLQQIFGQHTECGAIIIDYLTRKLYSNFFIWSAENNVTVQSVQLFSKLVRNNEICRYLHKNETYWSISKICIQNEMPWLLLPSIVKKLIIKSLIVSLSFTETEISATSFIDTIIKPLIQRLDSLLFAKRELHTESVIKEVMSLIETFNGIIEGTSASLVKQLFPYILPRLHQSVQLLDIYHNYGEIVELILCMFNGVIENYLFYLDQDSSNQVYQIFLFLIQVFSKHNTGKRSIEANIEEDYYNDLLLFMSLLNTLQSKDLMQELFDNPNVTTTLTNNKIETIRVTSVDVVLHGLHFLIPLMNHEMLKFQALCREYFKLISTISEINAEKIFSSSIELFSSLIVSIEYGLNSGSGIEITRLCFECVEFLCKYSFKNNIQASNYGVFLKKLFEPIFNLIFRSSIEFDLFESCSYALYGLIACFHDKYTELVNMLLTQYTDEQLRNSIISGFQALIPNNFQLNMEKKNREKFVERFNQFCVQTYGLLFIK